MPKYVIPLQTTNNLGQTRRVGFELEFAGVELEVAASLIADSTDGRITKESEVEYTISSDKLGDFKVELDWSFAKEAARQRAEHGIDDDQPIDDRMMKWVTRLAGKIVPVEVVCPPVALDHLNALDSLAVNLRNAGALGTESSLLYAFGLHLNPELPDMQPQTIAGYLQAFILAEQWLILQHNVDFSRRVTPFIDLYPEHYSYVVMNYTDDTVQHQLIADYLNFNPTRNRALDLLPLFKELAPEQVSAVINDPRVKPRPTFHYRLPNCEIEHADWSLSKSWNLWCVVEYIAASHELRFELIEQWRQYQARLITFSEYPWHQELDRIYQDLLSA